MRIRSRGPRFSSSCLAGEGVGTGGARGRSLRRGDASSRRLSVRAKAIDGSIMNDERPPHRLYRHYSELPYSMRVLFTCVLLILGMGYLFALLNIYFTYAGRAGGNSLMLSYEDIVAGYSGSGKGSVLESALSGPMSSMLPPDERASILKWLRDGAAQAAYDSSIKP